MRIRERIQRNANNRVDFWYFAKVRKVHKEKSPFRWFDFSSRSSLNANLNDAVALFLLLLFFCEHLCAWENFLSCYITKFALNCSCTFSFFLLLWILHIVNVCIFEKRSQWVKDVTVFVNFNFDSCRRCSAIWQNVSRDRENVIVESIRYLTAPLKELLGCSWQEQSICMLALSNEKFNFIGVAWTVILDPEEKRSS